MSLLAFMLLWSFRACTYNPPTPPNPSPFWITILSNIFIGIDWGSKAMREQTGCFCEEKVNEMSYKRWDFFQAAQVAAADAMLKQSSLTGTLTQLSLICWFAECIGCIFTMLWCYWCISVNTEQNIVSLKTILCAAFVHFAWEHLYLLQVPYSQSQMLWILLWVLLQLCSLMKIELFLGCFFLC